MNNTNNTLDKKGLQKLLIMMYFSGLIEGTFIAWLLPPRAFIALGVMFLIIYIIAIKVYYGDRDA